MIAGVPCRLHPGKPDKGGYGRLSRHGEQLAHRVAWVEAHGPIPRGLHVLHGCDVPLCTEPRHLRLGTNAENVADRQRRGRQARGERYGLAKLTNVQATEIARRLASERGVDLAREFGVTKAAVSNIRTGRSWSWLTRPATKTARAA